MRRKWLPSWQGLKDNLWASLVIALLALVPFVWAWLAELPVLAKWLLLSLPPCAVAAFLIARERARLASQETFLTRYEKSSVERLKRLALSLAAEIASVRDAEDLTPFVNNCRQKSAGIREESDRLGLYFPRVFREANQVANRIHFGLEARETSETARLLVGAETRRSLEALVHACDDALEGRGKD